MANNIPCMLAKISLSILIAYAAILDLLINTYLEGEYLVAIIFTTIRKGVAATNR